MHDIKEPETYADLTTQQKRSGLAAWLGWMFDGLDMHLYTLVALPFVAQLAPRAVKSRGLHESSLIQGAFLVGWAVGGGFFRADRRSARPQPRADSDDPDLRRFSPGSPTLRRRGGSSDFPFPRRARHRRGMGGRRIPPRRDVAKTLAPLAGCHSQTAVNCGVLLACVFGWLLLTEFKFPHRALFLVGILPALITLWIRKAVPEPEVWAKAHDQAPARDRAFSALFRGQLLRTTLVVTTVCALGLTAHWALMFWHSAHLRSLAQTAGWAADQQNTIANKALYLLMIGSIIGNFFAGWVARAIGYARAIAVMFALYFIFMMGAYGTIRDPVTILYFLPFIGLAQGAFALFTMCLPPLFPTLLRTTGAGFSYNIGRIIAAIGTVTFGLFAKVGTGDGAICDHRLALLYSAWLFIPAALVSWFLLPEPDRDIALAPIAE